MKLRGFLVTVKGPCPAYVFHFRIPARDLYSAKGFIDEYKRFLDEIDKEYSARFERGEFDVLFQEFGLKRTGKVPKRDFYIQVLRRGRGKKSKYVITLLVSNSVFWYYIEKSKEPIYDFLRNNSLALRKAAEYIYLIPESYATNLVDLVERGNRLLSYLDDFFAEFWELVRDNINDMFKKYQIDYELPPRPPKEVPKIQVDLTPIYFDKKTYLEWMEKDPRVAKYLRTTMDRYLKYILDNIGELAKALYTRIKEKRAIRKVHLERITMIEAVINELGLGALFQDVINDVKGLAEKKIDIDKFDPNIWRINVEEKIESWWEEQ